MLVGLQPGWLILMKNLAIIPARKGSQGLPGKNGMQLGGKSITQLAVECAQAAGCFQQVVLSSDWPELLEMAKGLGATALERPVTLAGPDSTIDEVVESVLNTVDLPEGGWDAVCVLNPTSPFRTAYDVFQCLELHRKYHVQGVVSIYGLKPLFMTRHRKGTRKLWHHANFSFRNRQRRKPIYAQNGAVYVVDYRYFEETKKLVGEKVMTYEMPIHRSLDIDTAWDFMTAEAWYPEFVKLYGQPNGKPVAPETSAAPVAGEAVLDGGSGAGGGSQ